MEISSEQIIEEVKEQARKLGYNWIKIVRIIPPNGADNWEVIIDVGITEEKHKKIFFDKNGKFFKFE